MALSPAKSPDLSAKNRDGRLGGSAAPRNNTPRIRTQVRGIPVADDLESLECVYVGVQRTRSYSPIQGNSQVGRIPGNTVLSVVLARMGCRPAMPSLPGRPPKS